MWQWSLWRTSLIIKTVGVSKVVTVINTVNGKKLLIYSVEIDEKKVVLSFDAKNNNLALTYRKQINIINLKVINFKVNYKKEWFYVYRKRTRIVGLKCIICYG